MDSQAQEALSSPVVSKAGLSFCPTLTERPHRQPSSCQCCYNVCSVWEGTGLHLSETSHNAKELENGFSHSAPDMNVPLQKTEMIMPL